VLVTGAGIFIVVVAVVIPGWANNERFLSVQRLTPQLKLVPAPATLIGKSQVIQPGILSTAVYVEYDYRLSPITDVAIRSYYHMQLTDRGWRPLDESISTHPSTPGFSDVNLSYQRSGQHGDKLQYEVSYYNDTRELDVKVESLLNGTNN
jgi:hypothetical protein